MFNVADASISVGVAVLVAGMWIEERRRPRVAGDAGGSGGTPRPDHDVAEPPAR
jgi:hypothetical protein